MDNPEYVEPVGGTAEPGALGMAQPGDPRELQVHRDQPPRDVPYLPTDQHVVNKMLEMAKVTKQDVLYDLGCGDGRICITAAKLGARAVGVEIDLQRLRECYDNLRNTQLKHLVEFRRESFFDTDLRPATVLAIYLLPAINKLLRPKMLRELRPGARIIANYFEIADWKPDEQIVFKHRPIMLWIVPAWVEGHWRCTFASAEGHTHVDLHLVRAFQVLSGQYRLGGRVVYGTEGRVRGTVVKVTLPEVPALHGLRRGGPAVNVEAEYVSNAERPTAATLRGTWTSGSQRGTFAAVRVEGK
jgi:precorrin-6B methylase 2